MIVDQGCSRAAVFLPCDMMITSPGIAQLYLDNVYQWFGLPTKVISDRNPRFTSHFSRALTDKLQTRQNVSTAFHPQTDGLSERKNQWVEQYLRLVTSASPEDWTYWLTIATAVHNNRKNTTTGLSPNEVLIGYEPTLQPATTPPSNNDMAEHRVDTLIEKRGLAIEAINRAAKQGGVPPAQYKKGKQVWLEATNLNLRHQKTKLALKRYGPFVITEEISPVAYHLDLPLAWNIHNVFHASLLSPYHETRQHGPNYSRPPPDLINGEEEYVVEKIINHRRHGRSRTLQYLIKWEGYPKSDNTWESAGQVHTPECVKQYHKKFPLEDKRAMRSTIKRILLSHQQCPMSASRLQTTSPSSSTKMTISLTARPPSPPEPWMPFSVPESPPPMTSDKSPNPS